MSKWPFASAAGLRDPHLKQKCGADEDHPHHTSCTLNQNLYETEQETKRQIDLALSRLVKERGITEELKATAPLRWAQEMNNAKQSAEELVLNEIIYH